MIGKFDAYFETLIVGERFKRGVYRPCIETIPSSTVAGFFRESFGIPDVAGVGRVDLSSCQRKRVVVSLFDEALGGVSLPIETEYLAPLNKEIHAAIYINWDESLDTLNTIKRLSVSMGAWRFKGFGRGFLSFDQLFEPKIMAVELKTRLTTGAAQTLGVRRELAPVYGYLFEATSPASGRWKRSLFEGSVVEGPDFLGEVYPYDI